MLQESAYAPTGTYALPWFWSKAEGSRRTIDDRCRAWYCIGVQCIVLYNLYMCFRTWETRFKFYFQFYSIRHFSILFLTKAGNMKISLIVNIDVSQYDQSLQDNIAVNCHKIQMDLWTHYDTICNVALRFSFVSDQSITLSHYHTNNINIKS